MKLGFTLLEVLVVLSCVTLTLSCAFFMYEVCIKTVSATHKRSDEVVQLCRALHLMANDISHAIDVGSGAWYCSDEKVMWPVAGGHCSYRVKAGRLLRSCKTGVQSLIASGVHAMQVVPDIYGGKMRGVTITLQGATQKISIYCACGVPCIRL